MPIILYEKIQEGTYCKKFYEYRMLSRDIDMLCFPYGEEFLQFFELIISNESKSVWKFVWKAE